ncbi:MAG: signal peptidase I [Dehalococcoidia bacterium]|nr:signal peptidase I [Dehalococcoidia bacterium]
MTRRRYPAGFSAVLAVAAVVVLWWHFGPAQLGGPTSYIIVNGNSMEPGMERGDLALVRRAASYETGDVVTYRHPSVGPVIHRVIGTEGARLVLQGDNNDFVDGYRPAADEVIGELWFHVPRVGSWLARLHGPLSAAALLALAFGGLAVGTGGVRRARRHGRRLHNRDGRGPMNAPGKAWQDAALVLACAAVAFAALLAAAYLRSPQRAEQVELPYTQSGVFTYEAAASGSGVYDSGAATTGQPVYSALSDEVVVRFAYTVSGEAEQLAGVAGAYRLRAELSDRNGWVRTFDLGEGRFDGAAFEASAALRLSSLREAVAAFETTTGVRNQEYQVAIAPDVTATGTIGGEALELAFAPRLELILDPFQLRVAPARSQGEQPMAPEAEGSVMAVHRVADRLPLPLYQPTVVAARWTGLAGLGVSLATLGGVLLVLFRSAPERGPEGMAGLVRVHSVPTSRSRTIDVASFADLVRVAEKEGCAILQQTRPDYEACFVQAGEVTYRFEAAPQGPGRAGEHRGAA